jgi:hypothetical protein
LIDQSEKMFPPSMLEKFSESVTQDIQQGGRCSGVHPYDWTEGVRRVWRGAALFC